jgi:hypothetical protein
VTESAGETAPDSEARALVRVLDGQDRHVLGILDGLDADALRRPVLSSGWHWNVPPEASAVDVLDGYRQEAELADAVITTSPADAPADADPAWWPHDLFGEPHLAS